MGASGATIFSVLTVTSPEPGPVVEAICFWTAMAALAARAENEEVPGGEAQEVPWKVLYVPALACSWSWARARPV